MNNDNIENSFFFEKLNIKISIETFFILIIVSFFLFILFSISLYYYQYKIINTDLRYYFYVLFPSFLAGGMLYPYIVNKFFSNFESINVIEHPESKFNKFLIYIFLTLISFFSISNFIFKQYMIYTSKNKSIEYFECKVKQFEKRTSRGVAHYKINYQFLKSDEDIEISFLQIEPYLDKNPKDYKLIITARKTAWDYYILENWCVEKKSDSIN